MDVFLRKIFVFRLLICIFVAVFRKYEGKTSVGRP